MIGPSMVLIVPYTVPSASFWKLGQAKPGDDFNFVKISVDKAQVRSRTSSISCEKLV